MISRASSVLLAVAIELSELAKTSLPALQKGETVRREWFKDETFYRETELKGQKYIAQFNFPQRKALMEKSYTND